MRLAIIPARGGSKRIPRKNIKSFFGKPAIVRAIELAASSNVFDKIIVSSDDPEILRISEESGASLIKRPEFLSNDICGTTPVVKHAIESLERHTCAVREVCCIYPVTPLLTKEMLLEGLSILEQWGDKFIFPVIRLSTPPSRAFFIRENGHIELQSLDASNSRTQDLRPGYKDAGQFYWGMRDSWMNFENIHQHGCGIDSGKWGFIDIDEPEDWEMAELIYSGRIKNRNSGS